MSLDLPRGIVWSSSYYFYSFIATSQPVRALRSGFAAGPPLCACQLISRSASDHTSNQLQCDMHTCELLSATRDCPQSRVLRPIPRGARAADACLCFKPDFFCHLSTFLQGEFTKDAGLANQRLRIPGLPDNFQGFPG